MLRSRDERSRRILEIAEKYGNNIVMQEEMPPIDWPSMGRYVYMARFTDMEEMDEYFNFVLV